MKTTEILTQQVNAITEDNRKLRQLIDKLQKKISYYSLATERTQELPKKVVF